MSTQVYGNGANSSAGANTIVHYYDRAGIKAANRVNVYGQFLDRKSMPTKMGKTFKISKFLHMYDRSVNDGEFGEKGFLSLRSIDDVSASLASASLTEGAGAVNERALEKVTMNTSLARYGEMINYTDEVDLFSEDSIQVRYREELGELANSRMEDLMQLDMLATPTVMYGGDATAIAEIDEDSMVTYDLMRKATRKLVRNRAKKNTQMVVGADKIGTTPVAKSYYAVIGANVKGDLESLTRGTVAANGKTEFVYNPAHTYANASTLAEGEVGAMHEIRFIESESAVVYAGKGADSSGHSGSLAQTGNKFDAFPILFPTQGSFAGVSLKGQGKIKFNSKAPQIVENSNPYGTKGFFSYNFFYAGIILEEEKLLKILVSASQ
jgi:N4-gp56 family major capsid protein